MRPPEVVGLHEERHPPLAVLEVGKHRTREEFVPQRLPKALDLAQRLRMVGPALDVLDALALELPLEVRPPAPGHILAALVRQDLARRTVFGDPARQGFQNQRRALVVRHHQGHHVARVVVHEGRHVQPLVPTQQEGEDVRLPELIRLRALEALLARTRFGYKSRDALDQSFLVQDSPHRRLRDAQTLKARHQVPDAPCAMLRVLLPRRHHRRPARVRARSITLRLPMLPVRFPPRARICSVPPVPVRPVHDRRHGDTKGFRHRHGLRATIHHRLR
jgi:hypothetical protein